MTRDIRAAARTLTEAFSSDLLTLINRDPDMIRDVAAAYLATQKTPQTLHFVFDGPPGPEAGRFVECETPDGRSINAGGWHEREDGFWELRVHLPATVWSDDSSAKPTA